MQPFVFNAMSSPGLMRQSSCATTVLDIASEKNDEDVSRGVVRRDMRSTSTGFAIADQHSDKTERQSGPADRFFEFTFEILSIVRRRIPLGLGYLLSGGSARGDCVEMRGLSACLCLSTK